MPRVRSGPLEWAVAGILLLGLIALLVLPGSAWVPLTIMGLPSATTPAVGVWNIVE